MWGPLRSVCPFFFLASFACCLGNSAVLDEAGKTIIPTIHPIPINQTLIPHEYLGLPVVGKCCKVDEVLAKNDSDDEAKCSANSNTASNESFTPMFVKNNKTGVLPPSYEEKEFVAIVGDPCRHKRYMLDPSESSDDEYYLLLNGSIFAPHHEPRMLTPGLDYCMEVVPQLGTRVLVCFPEGLYYQVHSFMLFKNKLPRRILLTVLSICIHVYMHISIDVRFKQEREIRDEAEKFC